MKTALLVNDDGIDAVGLETLKEKLLEEGFKVYIAAPSKQQSGTGKGIKLRVKVCEREVPGAEKAWAVDAPPAAIVYIALKALLPEKPDVVVSGINHGPNLGFEDFLTSGTIGAAIEAALQKIPAIAVSTTDWNANSEEEFTPAAQLSAKLASFLTSQDIEAHWKSKAAPLVIVNSPVKPKGAILTRIAWNVYRTRIQVNSNVASPIWDPEDIYDRNPPEGTDIWAVRNGYASISIVDLEAMANGMNILPDEIRECARDYVEKLSLQIFSP